MKIFNLIMFTVTVLSISTSQNLAFASSKRPGAMERLEARQDKRSKKAKEKKEALEEAKKKKAASEIGSSSSPAPSETSAPKEN